MTPRGVTFIFWVHCHTLEMELESLVLPEARTAADAGKLIERLPELWPGSNMHERRNLLLAMLDAVYVDTKTRSVVALRPKAPLSPIFQLATTSAGSGVTLTPAPGQPQQEPGGQVVEAVFS